MATSKKLSLKATPELDITSTGVASDLETIYPVGMTVMAVDGTDIIIVIDLTNMCVKSFYKKDGASHHSKLSLESKPLDMTKFQNNQVAVTLPNRNQISIVGVNPDLKLQLLTTIDTSNKYIGITSLTKSTLAVSFTRKAYLTLPHKELLSKPPKSPFTLYDEIPVTCLDILKFRPSHIHGMTVEKQLLIDQITIIEYPSFLSTTTSGNILVSDKKTRCFVCLTPQGGVVFNYRPTALEDPATFTLRMTSLSTGDILVTDYHLHSVIHMTASGEVVGTIPTDLKNPRGIYEDGSGRVYVLLDGIKVFTFVTQ